MFESRVNDPLSGKDLTSGQRASAIYCSRWRSLTLTQVRCRHTDTKCGQIHGMISREMAQQSPFSDKLFKSSRLERSSITVLVIPDVVGRRSGCLQRQ